MEDKDYYKLKDILKIIVDELELSMKNSSNNYIKSGFDELDQILQGFNNGSLNIIASKPGVGKTLFALNLFSDIADKENKALYISFEKKETELMKIIIAMKTGIKYEAINNGLLKSSDFAKVVDTLSLYYDKNNIFLKTFFNCDLYNLRNFIKEIIDKEKIEIIFIDYLTMISFSQTNLNKCEQISEICRSLKSMALEFNIPIVVLCPINNDIENDADKIIILNRKNKENNPNPNLTYMTASVVKNRIGSTANIDFTFDYEKKLIKFNYIF